MKLNKAQNLLEYALLVGIAVVMLLVSTFLIKLHTPNNAFNRFFNKTSSYITGNY